MTHMPTAHIIVILSRVPVGVYWTAKYGTHTIDWLSMVLRLHQHNIGYTVDGFYRSDDPTNSVKALKEGG